MRDMIPAWVDGTLTPVEKLDVHRRGLRHKAISVFVMRGADLLIQQRALGKYHTPGLWANTCCTHPHWGETAINCANRRLEQELGITDLTLHPRGQLSYRANVGGGLIEDELVDVFVAEARNDVTLRLDPTEVMATEWIALPDLIAQVTAQPERFTPWLRIYLEQHRDTIFAP